MLYVNLDYLLEHLLTAESERQRMQRARTEFSLQKGFQVLYSKPKVTKKCFAPPRHCISRVKPARERLWHCISRGNRFPEALRSSQRLPEAPRGSQMLPKALRGSQWFPEASRSPQKLPEAPRGSRRLPEALRGSHKLREARRSSQRLADAPRSS